MLMDFGAPIIPTNLSSDPESHLPFNPPLRLLLLPLARSAIQSLLRWHGREWSEVCMQAMQQWRMEKGKQISGGFGSGLSAPLCGPSPTHQAEELLEGEDDILSEERKAVEQLVQQSLHNTMKRMVKRANLPQDFVASHHFKSLSSSSTSKSLAF